MTDDPVPAKLIAVVFDSFPKAQNIINFVSLKDNYGGFNSFRNSVFSGLLPYKHVYQICTSLYNEAFLQKNV